MARIDPTLQTTTLWQFPSQHYGGRQQGSKQYRGATPSYVIWNLLQRYTEPKQLVIDPMAGSGTTLDVARDLGRRALGYDLQPQREGIFRADARKLPLEDGKADFVFVDPPYGDNLKYSGEAACIGELPADQPGYFEAMGQVFAEIDRVLRPDRHMAVYVCDVWKRRAFVPIGARLTVMLAERFEPVDHIAVTRGNKDLQKGNYHKAAEESGFFLRGYNHLLIFKKPAERGSAPPRPAKAKRRPAPERGGGRGAGGGSRGAGGESRGSRGRGPRNPR